jgi:hypothetical protein
VFDGFDDIYVKAALLDNFDKKNTIGGLAGHELVFFAFYRCLLSFFYPDNFILQLLKIIAKTYSNSTMAFPIVFITFNIFVFPIWGGNILLKERSECRYLFPINPQFFDNNALTSVLGGFSAAISMIIVSSISLSTMLSNNLLIPYGFVGSLDTSQEKKQTNLELKEDRYFLIDYSILFHL